jgi:hypothetical protein
MSLNVVASRFVHTGTASRPSIGGTTASEPVAMTRWSAVRLRPSTSTAPGPVIRAMPLITVAPDFSYPATWLLSSRFQIM